jgi:hypothetical protein
VKADAGGVTGIERSLVVEVRDVVGCVARGREAIEPEDSVADDVDVGGRDGSELAPQGVERLAVESARARLQPVRLDQVRCSDGGNVHLQAGVEAGEDTRGAGMVEVDV